MGVPAGRNLPQSLDWIGFGVESFGGAGTAIGGRFDNIVVSADRVGCGSKPGEADTTTTTTTTTPTNPTTSTTQSTSTTSTTSTSCGYIPATCGKSLTRIFDKRGIKTLGKFEEITGVQLAEATVEDIQLYFHCRGRNPSKCPALVQVLLASVQEKNLQQPAQMQALLLQVQA